MTFRIYRAKVIDARVRNSHCPTCLARMPTLQVSYEWHGPIEVCLNCGDMWIDKEMMARDFFKGWRKARVEAAIAWAQALGVEIYSHEA